MTAYFANRLLQAIPVLLLSSIAVFLLVRLLPGDPAILLAGGDLANLSNPESVAALRKQYGLDQPLPVQYWVWLSHVLQGNLGTSVRSHQPVWEVIGARIPATVQLTIAAMLLTPLLALPAG